MDYLRVGNKLSSQEWKKHINKKYQNIKFDGIFINSTFALKIFKEFGNDFMPDVPKVYNEKSDLIYKQNELNLSLHRRTTVAKTLALALRLHPNTKKLYTIKGSWKDSIYLKELLPKFLKKHSHIQHIEIKDFTYGELQEEIRKIGEDSLLIPTILDQDKSGLKRPPIDIMKFISKANPDIPMYSFLTTFLDSNLSGGNMLNGTIHAQTVIDEIMMYKETKAFSKKQKYEMKSYLKYEAIKKFNINENLIPKDVIILNKPKSIWESYYYEVVSAIVVIFILLILLAFMIHLFYKLKETNKKLQKETKEKIEKEKLLNQQTKNALMGEMISNIAHQWRQPLNRINSNIAVVKLFNKQAKSSNENINKKLDNIEEQTKYMSNTIDDFFNFVSTNKEKKAFLINDSIKQTINLLESRLKKVEVINTIKEIKLYSYQNEFSQVVLSIVNNALDNFQIKKIKNPKLFFNSKIDEEYITIEISDNGGGVDESIINKVFEAHVSTKKDGKSKGLGLYISKNIIENSMNGKLKVSNTKDGVLFTIIFKRSEIE